MRFIVKPKYLIILPLVATATYFAAPEDRVSAAIPVSIHSAIQNEKEMGARSLASDFRPSRRAQARNLQLARLSPMQNQPLQANQKKSEQFSEWSQYQGEEETVQQIYHPDLTRNLRDKYKDTVAPSDQIVENPYRFARPWERQSNIDSNKEMAQWTAREVVNDRMTHLFNRADKDSAPVKMANKAKILFGGEIGESDKKDPSIAEPKKGLKPTAEQVAAANPKGDHQQLAVISDAEPKKEKIPTKLKYKMNVIKGTGEIRFTNPVVITSVNVDVNRKIPDGQIQTLDTSDSVSAQMTKKIEPLDLDSSVSYGVNKKVVSLNLTKKITNQITCDYTSQRFTSDYRDSSGNNSAEQVRMMYSISF